MKSLNLQIKTIFLFTLLNNTLIVKITNCYMASQHTIFYIIAGEASGDILGAKLMTALKQKTPNAKFYGIGGTLMQDQGLTSLFPMHELSLMGIFEIIPNIIHIYKRIYQTVSNIKQINPDIIITIDSQGFCCRVINKLKHINIPKIHYVAPTVWAWKKNRIYKFEKLFNKVLCLYPFEPNYFKKVNLDAVFIGHPLSERKHSNTDVQQLKEQLKIPQTATILLLLPGSRKNEIKNHLIEFIKAYKIIKKTIPSMQPICLTLPHLRTNIAKTALSLNQDLIIIDDEKLKDNIFSITDFALAASGTVALELSIAKVPSVIAYKLNILSYYILKAMINLKYAHIINILANKEIIPELIQFKCKDYILAEAILNLSLNNNVNEQISNVDTEVKKLYAPNNMKSSDIAALEILKLLN